MPVRLAEPPQQIVDAVRETLLAWARRGEFRTPALSKAKTGDLGLTLPHPVYALTLQDLTDGRGPSAAEHVAWRFLLQDGERVVAAVEVAVGGGPPMVNEGPYVRATASVISTLEQLPGAEGHDYELRLLKVVALYLVSVWLHEGDGSGDLLVPIGEVPAGIEADRAYRAEELTGQLAEPARAQLAFDSTPKAPSEPS
jgi:hypothetical protein